jgi:hypothetical protein
MNAEFTAEEVNSQIRSMVVDTIGGAGSGSVKSRIREAARRLGLSVDRVREFYYNRVRRIEAHEAFQIIKRSEIAKREQFDREQIQYEARRLELVNSTPSWLAFLVPPAVAPLPPLEEGPLDPIKDDC